MNVSLIANPESGKGIHARAQYFNSGKEPALDLLVMQWTRIFSIQQWIDGSAADEIIGLRNNCFAWRPVAGSRVAYPAVGGYNLQWVTDDEDQNTKLVATDGVVSGEEYFMVEGCLVYRSGGSDRHSAFCYWYRAKHTESIVNLNICTVGNDAD